MDNSWITLKNPLPYMLTKIQKKKINWFIKNIFKNLPRNMQSWK